MPSSKESDGNLYIIVDNHNDMVNVQFAVSNPTFASISPTSITVPVGTPIQVNGNVLTIGDYTITASSGLSEWEGIPQSGRVEAEMDTIVAVYIIIT